MTSTKKVARIVVTLTVTVVIGTVVVLHMFADTMLMTAVERNSYAVSVIAISAGADIDRVHYEEHFKITPLMRAILNHNSRIAELLLRRGADINATTDNGESALITAAQVGDRVMIDTLCDMGANVHQRGRNGTATMVAFVNEDEDAVELLLRRGGGLHSKSLADFLWRAVRRGDPRRVEVLLRAGAPPNLPAQTPLQIAAQAGECDIAKLLVAAGADRGATDCSGNTAADIARLAGHKECATVLEGDLDAGQMSFSKPDGDRKEEHEEPFVPIAR